MSNNIKFFYLLKIESSIYNILILTITTGEEGRAMTLFFPNGLRSSVLRFLLLLLLFVVPLYIFIF